MLGHDTTRLPAYRTARLGVGRTFQTPRVFEDLSIWENLLIGADFGRDRRRADWLFRALRDVEERWRAQRPDFLPHAQRRLLEVLRVIAMDCDVLLLDEPAAGLVAGGAARIRDTAAPSARRASARRSFWSSTTSTWSGASPIG